MLAQDSSCTETSGNHARLRSRRKTKEFFELINRTGIDGAVIALRRIY